MKRMLKRLFTTPTGKLFTKNYIIALGIGSLLAIGLGLSPLPSWVTIGVGLPCMWVLIAIGNLLDWHEHEKRAKHG